MKKSLRGILILLITTCWFNAAAQIQEPTNHVTGFSVTALSSSEITLSWTDATGPTLPEFYLILGRKTTGGTFASVGSGDIPLIPADADWSDGNFADIVAFSDPNIFNITGLDAETEYEFAIYSYRTTGGTPGEADYKEGGRPSGSDFTFSLEPGSHSTTFTATLNGSTTIDLAFDAANTLTNTDGYLIYRLTGSAVNLTGLTDGGSPPNPLNGATLIHTTTSAATTYSDSGLQGGLTYHYTLVPFNYNGSNASTYNYLNNGAAPAASAATTLVVTLNQIAGGGSNIAASPLNSGANNQAILGFSITTNGSTTFNALTVSLTTTATGKFLNPRIFKSTDAVFGGDASINTGTIGTQLQFTAINETLTAGTTNYFIVVNVEAGVNASTPATEPAFTQAGITFISPAITPGSITITGTNYSFVDATPPNISFQPANGAVNFSAVGNITISFDEPIRKLNDAPITSADIEGGLVELKVTNDGGATVGFVGSINGANTVITLNPNATLLPNQVYYVEVNPVEDNNNNATVAQSITFTTEDKPAITSFTPTATCIGNNVTVNGSRFSGTGNPASGNSIPTITVNGVTIPAANILPGHSSSSVTFTIPAGVSTGAITIRNNDSDLVSLNSASTLTVNPAINVGLSTATNITPSVGSNFNIVVGGNSQNTVSYRVQRPNLTFTSQQTGNGSQLSFGPFSHASPGSYTYRVEASSSGCTTVFLADVVVNIAALSVDAGNDRVICAGESVTLGGNPPASGGTGFFSYSWTSTPSGFSSSSPNPTVSPLISRTYNLTVTDNSGATLVDQIIVTVNPKPTAAFDPSTRTSFIVTEGAYELLGSGTPAGGTNSFSGLGVTQSGTGAYYFNPSVAGIGTNIPLTYTYTDSNSCTDQAVIFVNVLSQSPVLGLASQYCSNAGLSNVLSPNPAVVPVTVNTKMKFANRSGVYLNELDPNYPLIQVSALPYTYRLDPLKASLILGGNSEFTIVVYETINFPLLGLVDFVYGTAFSGVTRPGTIPFITSIAAGEICNDAAPVVLQTNLDNSGYTPINYRVFDFFSGIEHSPNAITSPGPNIFEFNPATITFPGNEGSRFLQLQYNYQDNNGCAGTTSKNFYVDRKPLPPIGNDTQYCQFFNGQLNLEASGEFRNLQWFENSNLSDPNPLRGEIINTGLNSLTPISKTFYAVDNNFSCRSNPASIIIQVTPVPDATVTVPTACLGVPFLINPPTIPNILSYQWDLGDGSPVQTTATANHKYETLGPFTLKFRGIINSNGQQCPVGDTVAIAVGEVPKPNFTFAQICRGDQTRFFGSSTIPAQVQQYKWNFNNTILNAGNLGATPPVPFGGTYQNPTYQFPTSGDFLVTVTSITNLGCRDSTTKTITILDTYGTPYDMSVVESGRGGWRVDTESIYPSWEFAPANKNILTTSTPVWVTRSNAPYNANERSYLNSPCFSIGISRPAISIDYFSNTPERLDGSVLEYSINGGDTWNPLDLGTGQLGTGLNWFNTLGFFLGNIGSSSIGWSGNLWESSTSPFVKGRHSLDGATGAKVRFRVAFASGTGDKSAYDGFALKAIKIESRNRNLLIENFTQESFNSNNNSFTVIPATEGTKLQYHIGFPGSDNIHAQNTADIDARAAYYGITNSPGVVPRAYIDGYSNGNFLGSWNNLYRGLRSLAPAPITMSIATLEPTNTDELKFEVTIIPTTATSEIPIGSKPVLHVAIIEKVVGSNNFVVRKMIPNAAGRLLTVPVNSTLTESYSWKPVSPNFVRNQIAIVAFVQDEITQEVYQSAELLNPTIDHIPNPSIITAIEDLAEYIQIYPNPANESFEIELPAKVESRVMVNLIDPVGRTAQQLYFEKGEQTKTVNTQNLAQGVYVVQIGSGNTGVVRKKVLVVH
ncbi:MAG: Ig-like domain-containing protein [Cyclobacteriaceae bacterium]|nr:Ig-like domain-containing protein [Cyclobacteriaceae bacterium]